MTCFECLSHKSLLCGSLGPEFLLCRRPDSCSHLDLCPHIKSTSITEVFFSATRSVFHHILPTPNEMARYSMTTTPPLLNQSHFFKFCVDDMLYTPSATEKKRDLSQLLRTGRRNWKTLRGKGEAVWSSQLYVASYRSISL